jgi:hypothetical protein
MRVLGNLGHKKSWSSYRTPPAKEDSTLAAPSLLSFCPWTSE